MGGTCKKHRKRHYITITRVVIVAVLVSSDTTYGSICPAALGRYPPVRNTFHRGLLGGCAATLGAVECRVYCRSGKLFAKHLPITNPRHHLR